MTRFRPTRAGLINIWDYVDEEFVFADGRLVLRGHNGSGKTKALEVLFPFILDGVADARRLDPFSGENRTMKSNLLYRGQESEYGFVWMEFAGGDTPDADAVTLIIALRAHKDKPAASTSFFVTRRRIGLDFGLLSADSRPLTERQLETILGSECRFDSATKYRDAIDHALFGLGRQRYSQLLDLLLALRRPLLAKDLDPAKVSDTLTAGLSPISEDLIEQAARDFENLAAVQSLVEDLNAADSAASAFLHVYSDYMMVEARSRLSRFAERTKQATEHATRLREASLEITRATTAEDKARASMAEADKRRTTLEGQLAGLKRDEAYTGQGRLNDLRDRVAAGNRDLKERRQTHVTNGRHLTDLTREAGDLAEKLKQYHLTAGRHGADQARAAQTAGIDDSETDLQTAKARAATRRDDVDHVRAHLSEVADAVTRQQQAADAVSAADTKLERSESSCWEAEKAVDQARARAQQLLNDWIGRWGAPLSGEALGDVDVNPAAAIVAADEVTALTQALAALDGENEAVPLPALFGELTEQRRSLLGDERTRLGIEHQRIRGDRDVLHTEREQVAAERDDAPMPASTRNSDRSGRPGGPLWQLVRFADDVDDTQAAAIEAALESAGLLTAWIHPDPALTDTAYRDGEHDAYLRPLPPAQRTAGPTLASVLTPDDQDLVPTNVISDILAGIALSPLLGSAEAGPAVSSAGQFTFGIHLGAYSKPIPQYIGATYRATRRAARIAGYDQRINDLDREIEQLQRQQQQIEEHLKQLRQARGELPPIAPIQSALTRLSTTSALLAQARTEQSDAAKKLDAATAETEAARRRLRLAAAERSLPAEASPVDLIAQAIDDFLQAAREADKVKATIIAISEEADRRTEMITRMGEEHAEEAERIEEKAAAHLHLTEELAGLEEKLSAPLKQVLDKIGQAEAGITAARSDWDSADEKARQEHDARVQAETAYRYCEQSVRDAVTALLEAAHPLAVFIETDLRPLLGVTATTSWPHSSQWLPSEQATAQLIPLLAAPDTSNADSADADTANGTSVVCNALQTLIPGDAAQLISLLDAAATGRSAGENARKAARQRLSDALKEFNEALATRKEDYRLDWQAGDTVITVNVYDADGRHPVADFAARVHDRCEEQKFLLEEREQTVLENELLTALAQQVFDRVYFARDLVKNMDADIRSRPMTNGLTFGIRWVASDKLTDLQRQVSDLLGYQQLGPDQLAYLRQLLRQMLREYRAAHPRDTYQEALSAVLDYRAWRTFELRLKVPGEEEVKLSKKRHTLLSGGEKSAAIHLPFFAAANTIYSSAHATCPRMIALDEAFAGIDDRYKPDLLGLTVQYDLDAFMTGHDLWIRYDTVPAAAHYDMHSDKLSHTVSAMLILWDGTELLDAGAGYAGNEELAADLLGFTPTRHALNNEGLLADLQAFTDDGSLADADADHPHQEDSDQDSEEAVL
ncbi:TIGR02680 family protein [Actinomadura geliboluensis]|uniref:TIGR02680 family protein n=1 Tax=Actinomadura geliboluensis TaxID=882440 RepID=UPI0036933095